MPEDTDDLDQEAEETDEQPDPTTLTVEQWQKRESKLKQEAHKLRTQLRRTEMSKEYGDDVLELVPTSLSLDEQKDLAAKLKDRFAASKAPDAQATAGGPEVVIQEPQLVEIPESTQAERNLAAVAQGSPQAASSAQAPLTTQEAVLLAVNDPASYQRLKAAGLIKPETLEGAFG